MRSRSSTFTPYLLSAQGLYYLLAGAWPVLDMDSFLAVTGPKTDLWLVRTVGLLLVAIGASLVSAAISGRLGKDLVILALSCPLILSAIDICYVAKGLISLVYLLDGLVELLILGAWGYLWHKEARTSTEESGKGIVIGDPSRFSHRSGA